MAYQYVTVERDETVAIVTLNRPERLNALNNAMMAEIDQIFGELEEQAEVRVVVVAGSEKSFAAGADVQEIEVLKTAHDGYRFAVQRAAVYDRIYYFPKPVIAAVSGYALGGGCELVLASDIRIASETAKLGLPEVTLGILPGCGIQRLVRLVGPGAAKELLFTGRMINAEEALRLGLVNRVVPQEALLNEAVALAKKIAAQPPWAIRLIKRAVTLGQDTDLPTAMELERLGFGLLFATEDMREGVAAFLEKRVATFKGK